MARNNAWANAVLHDALNQLPDEAAFHAPRPGFFPSLHATLSHICLVDLYYLDALEAGGLGARVFDQDLPQSRADVFAAQSTVDAHLIAFCEGLDDAALEADCITDRPEGPVTERTGTVLLHLFQHQIHHRGQAHVQLSAAGMAPPQLDEFHLIYDRAPSAQRYRLPTDPT